MLWREIVSGQLELMTANTSGLPGMRQLQALYDDDPSRLAVNAMPTYNRLSAASVLTKLQLTRSTRRRVVFYAAVREERPGRVLCLKRSSRGR